jgi:hypothetical protein
MALGLSWGAQALANPALPSAQALAPCPSPLRVAFLDVELRPFLHGKGDRFANPSGSLVEAMARTLTELGCPAQMQRLPVRRLVQGLHSGTLDIAIGLAPNEERLRLLHFPLDAQGQLDERLAIAETPIRLYAVAHSEAHLWKKLTAKGRSALRYGAMRGAVYAEELKAAGFHVEFTNDMVNGWSMLRMNRFDVHVVPEVLAPAGDEFQPIGPPLFTYRYFAPASTRFAAQHGMWLRNFWLGLCAHMRPNFPGTNSCPSTTPP